jgi:hypothetical protein
VSSNFLLFCSNSFVLHDCREHSSVASRGAGMAVLGSTGKLVTEGFISSLPIRLEYQQFQTKSPTRMSQSSGWHLYSECHRELAGTCTQNFRVVADTCTQNVTEEWLALVLRMSQSGGWYLYSEFHGIAASTCSQNVTE